MMVNGRKRKYYKNIKTVEELHLEDISPGEITLLLKEMGKEVNMMLFSHYYMDQMVKMVPFKVYLKC